MALLASSSGQNLLSNPESIVYDSVRGHYLVSNWSDDGPGHRGAIVRIDGNGDQSYFNTELMNVYRIAGLYIYGDSLLAAAGDHPSSGIAVFSLETATLVGFIGIPGIGLPNDITSDRDGVIYVTDYWGDALYRIVDGVPDLLFDSGLYNPNGILYDRANHRLLTLAPGTAGCPVMETSLVDSTISVIAYSGLGGYDGIVEDSGGRIYISEWTGDAVHRYDDPLLSGHIVFSSGHTDPADIYYDPTHDLICVPNFSTHSIDYVPVGSAAIMDERTGHPRAGITLLPSRPNPCDGSTSIRYVMGDAGEIRIILYDIQGRMVRELAGGWRGAGHHREVLDLSSLAAGVYPYRIESNRQIETGTIVLTR
jgi:hypothetical protein